MQSTQRVCEPHFVRSTLGAALGAPVNGPSTKDLVGHHLTQALRHLVAAAEAARDLSREDAAELAMSLERMAEGVRDVRGEIEGPKP